MTTSKEGGFPSSGFSTKMDDSNGDPKYKTDYLHFYHMRFIREYRAICVLWGILSILWCILNVVCFVQPQWIGDTISPLSGYGHQGLYAQCSPGTIAGVYTYQGYVCEGTFGDFNSIGHSALKAATFFVGVSALLMLICIAGLLLFFCFNRRLVFYICGVLQLASAIFMFLGCIIFPAGWDTVFTQNLCSAESGPYKLGECGIRWAYILAIIGILDAAILAILAFVLAAKRAKLEMHAITTTGTVSKSELNGYSNDTMSKRSMPIQPVVTVPDSDQHERYSEYSHRSEKSKRSAHNFQL